MLKSIPEENNEVKEEENTERDYRQIFNTVMDELLYKMNFIAKSKDSVDEFLRDNIKLKKDSLEKEKNEYLEENEKQNKDIEKREEILKTVDFLLKDFESCSICLKEKGDIKYFGILNCMHIFCSECLLKSIVENFPCPQCRNEYGENDYLFFHKGVGDLYFSTKDKTVSDFYTASSILEMEDGEIEDTEENALVIRNFFNTYVQNYVLPEDYIEVQDNPIDTDDEEENPILQDLESQNENLRREVSEKNSEIRDLRGRLIETETQIIEKITQNEDLTLKNIDLEFENKQLKMEIEGLKTRLKNCNKRRNK